MTVGRQNSSHTLDHIICSIASGACVAGLFNPWDRALYLGHKYDRPFLNKLNFTAPYQGFSQSVAQRTLFGGLYYFLQAQMQAAIYPIARDRLGCHELTANLMIGLSVGTMYGMSMNSVSAVKYFTWGQDDRTFFSSACELWHKGGFKAFNNGLMATITRDAVFGSTYEVLRHLMRQKLAGSTKYDSYQRSQAEFACNMSAAAAASVLAGPFNHARNKQFATAPGQKQPAVTQVLKSVWRQAITENQSIVSRLMFFGQTFKVGWGTARVAVGMATGQYVFKKVENLIKKIRQGF